MSSFIEPAEHSVVEAYGAFQGYGNSLSLPVASNIRELKQIATVIADLFEQRLKKRPLELCLETRDLGTIPASTLDIDVAKLRKSGLAISADKTGVISCIKFEPAPSDNDARGIGIKASVKSLAFGENLRTVMQLHDQKRLRQRRRHIFVSSSRTWIDSDTVSISRAVRELVDVRFGGPAPQALAEYGELPEDWHNAESKGLRGFLALACLSQLPLRKAIFASGDGRCVLKAALPVSEQRIAQASKNKPVVIHRDGVPHFWFSEIARLGIDDVKVPLLRFS